jgi:hypothetical protein
MLHSSQRQRGGGAGASSAASRARFFAPRFGFGSPGFLPEKCTVSPACTLNMRAVVTGAVTAAASALPAATASALPAAAASALPAAAASALPAAAASVLPAAASLRAALAALRAALASLRALAALSSLLPVSEPASSCSSAKIRASSSLPICVLVAGQTGCARLPVAPGFWWTLVSKTSPGGRGFSLFLFLSFSFFSLFLMGELGLCHVTADRPRREAVPLDAGGAPRLIGAAQPPAARGLRYMQ